MAVNFAPGGDRVVNNYQSVSLASRANFTKLTAAVTVYCGGAPVVLRVLQLKEGRRKIFKLIGSVYVAPGSMMVNELILGLFRVSVKV